MAGVQSPSTCSAVAQAAGLAQEQLNSLHNVQEELRSEKRKGLATSPGTSQDALGFAEERAMGFAAIQTHLPPCVLALAGIELIFFLVAGIVLCFGFSMTIKLITH